MKRLNWAVFAALAFDAVVLTVLYLGVKAAWRLVQ